MNFASNRLAVLAHDIRAAHDDVQTSSKVMAERALTAGHLLLEAKANAGHGQWLPWLKENVGLSERTARRYMELAGSPIFDEIKTATVADLGIVGALRLFSSYAPPMPEQDEFYIGCDDSCLVYIWKPLDGPAGFTNIIAINADTAMLAGHDRGLRIELMWPIWLETRLAGFDLKKAHYRKLDGDEKQTHLNEAEYWRQELAEQRAQH